MRAAQPLAALADIVGERIEECADRCLRRLDEAVPELLEDGGLSREDLRSQSRQVLQTSLALLGDGRRLTPAELAWFRELGRRRAHQGIPAQAVVRALHATQLVLWDLLVVLAAEGGSAWSQPLLEEASSIWMTTDEMASAAQAGHAQATPGTDLEHRRASVRLLQALRGASWSAEAEQLCRFLDLDPEGSFVAAVHAGTEVASSLPTAGIAVEEPARTVVLVQARGEPPAEEVALAQVLRRQQRTAGVGVQRTGLPGATLSLRDAEMAFAAAATTGAAVLQFRRDWLTVLGVADRDTYEALLPDVTAGLRRDRETAATVAAFLDARGSLTAAGRELGVHANTVAYRLRRFTQRTGVDPRAASGGALLEIALALCRGDGCDGLGQPAAS